MSIIRCHINLSIAPTETVAKGELALDGLLDSVVIQFYDASVLGTIRVFCPFTGIMVAEVVRSNVASPLRTVIRPRLPETDINGAHLSSRGYLAVTELAVQAFGLGSSIGSAVLATVSATSVS
jgi:hypothetical protein